MADMELSQKTTSRSLFLIGVWSLLLIIGGAVEVVVDAKAGADTRGCGVGAPAAPCASLEYAIARLGATGGTVTLADGVHRISTPTGAYVAGRNLTIRGASPSRAVVDCSFGRCFNATCPQDDAPLAARCEGTSLELTGVAIRNGFRNASLNDAVAGEGGAIYVVGASLSLREVEFSNCSAAVGGAVYISAAASVTLANVSFTRCSAVLKAGALLATGVPRLSVTGALFAECSAGEAGAANLNDCSGVVARSQFGNCVASAHGGGAISVDLLSAATSTSRLRFEGCSFVNVSSAGSGGAIESWARALEFEDTRASNCSGRTGGFLHDVLRPAGANSSVAVRACAFEGCRSERGGALYISNAALSVRDSAFAGCRAQSSGGAVASGGGDVALARTNVTGCAAGVSGGAVEVSGGSLVVASCSFRENIAGTGGGCFSATLSEFFNNGVGHSFSAAVSDSEFSGCVSGTSGGGMFVYNAIQGFRLNISGTTFSNCTALRGGGIFSAGEGELRVAGSQFSGCAAASTGGGLSLVDTTTLAMTDVGLSECQAQRGGGLAFVRGARPSAPSSLLSCIFSHNAATGPGGGGAIYVGDDVSPVQVADALFEANAAEVDGGGAVAMFGQQLGVSGSLFVRNNAKKSGGAISSNRNASLEVEDSQFNANHGGLLGGALYLTDSSRAKISLSNFSSNTAGTGGAVCADSATQLALAGALLSLNNATDNGGALSVNEEAEAYLDTCQLRNNSAGKGGGALHGFGFSSIEAEGTAFSHNSAQGGGVAYTLLSISLAFARCQFVGNSASEGGGVAYLQLDSKMLAADCSFDGNAGASYGGCVYAGDAASFAAEGCNFSANTAETGGVAYLDGTAASRLTRCSLHGNAASLGGCFVTYDSASLELGEVSAEGNRAAWSGGVLAAGGRSNVSVYDSYLGGNVARSAPGGAVYVEAEAGFVIRVESCEFDGNVALRGGALGLSQIDGDSSYVYNSVFTRNFARGNASSSASSSSSTSASTSASAGAGIEIPIAAGAGAGGGNATTGSSSNGTQQQQQRQQQQEQELLLRTYGEGGAISMVSPSNLLLHNLSFRGNVAKRGGGVYQAYLEADPTFIDCFECVDAGGNRAAHGPFLATAPTSVRLLLGGSSGGSDSGDGSSGSGGMLVTSSERAPALHAQLLDSYGSVAFVATGAAVATIEPDPHLTGALAAVAAADGFEWTAVVAQTRPETDARAAVDAGLRFSTPVLVRSSAGEWPVPLAANLTFRFCPAGYHRSDAANATVATGGAAATAGEGAGGAAGCVPCELGYYCEASRSHQACPDGTFSFAERASGTGNCTSCRGDSLVCAGGVLTIKPGSWANLGQLASNPQAYQCSFAPAGCQGAVFRLSIPPDSPAQCAAGYRNERMCSKCAKGYYFLSSVNKCQKCSHLYKRLWVLLAVLVAVAWVALNVLCSLFESIDLLLTEMQFLTTLAGYNLAYFQGWINALMRIFQLSLFDPDFLGPDCIMGSYTFTHRWVVSAGLPLVAIGMCVCYFLYQELVSLLLLRRRRSLAAAGGASAARPSRPQTARQLVALVGQVLDIFYISVTTRCFQVFSSASFDAQVVSADVTIAWDSKTHHALVPFAIGYLVVYVVGFPLATASILLYGRATHKLHQEDFAEMFGWMYDRYEPQRWWFYVPFLSLRRIAFVSISVFLVSTPSLQAVLTLGVILLAILLQFYLHPCRRLSLNLLNEALLLGQVAYLLAGVGNSSTVHGSAATALGGAAVALYLLCCLLFVPYDVKRLWMSGWVRRWARLHSGPLEPPVSAWARLLPFRVHATRASVRQTTPLRGPGTADVAPLESITDWFHARVLYVFLMVATAADFRALQQVLRQHTLYAPTREQLEHTSRLFSTFTSELQYAAVVQLLYGDDDGNDGDGDGDGDDDVDKDIEGAVKGSKEEHGGGGVGGADADGGGDPEAGKARRGKSSGGSGGGGRHLRRLRSVNEQMLREKSRGDDSIRLLLSRHMLVEIVAWLLYGGADCAHAMRDLIVTVRSRLALSSEQGLLEKDAGEVVAASEGQGESPGGRFSLWFRLNLWFLRYFP